MKIAILLTGQLRTFEMCKYLHMKYLISKYDSDVYLGINICNTHQIVYKNSKDKTNTDKVKRAIDFFNPVDTFILDNFEDEFNKIKNKNTTNLHLLQGMFEQYYVVKNTYKMVLDNINKGKTYDLIFRLRFDQFIYSEDVPIAPQLYDTSYNTILYTPKNIDIIKEYTIDNYFKFDEIADNTIYLYGFGNYKNCKFANEQFWYHTPSIINQMFEYYDNFLPLLVYCNQRLIGNEGAPIYEWMFYIYLTEFNKINIKKSNITGIFLREFV